MTDLKETLKKITDLMDELKNTEIEFEGRMVRVDLAPPLFYMLGFTEGVVDGLIKNAKTQVELEMAGYAALMMLEATIMTGIQPMKKKDGSDGMFR
jgi:hypothetical protein